MKGVKKQDCRLTIGTEVEEGREGALVGQGGALLSQLVEKGMQTGLEGTEAFGRRVVQQLGHQLDGL